MVSMCPEPSGSACEMRMLVVSSCTGRKCVSHDRKLTLEDSRDPYRLRAREAELTGYRVPAHQLYTGLQHVFLMKGVRLLRERFGSSCVAVKIVSASYGLVSETQPLAPYEATFNEIAGREVLTRIVSTGFLMSSSTGWVATATWRAVAAIAVGLPTASTSSSKMAR